MPKDEHGKFMGVSTDDPDIVKAIRNMRENGAEKDQIMRVIGMPAEVIDKHVNRYDRDNKK